LSSWLFVAHSIAHTPSSLAGPTHRYLLIDVLEIDPDIVDRLETNGVHTFGRLAMLEDEDIEDYLKGTPKTADIRVLKRLRQFLQLDGKPDGRKDDMDLHNKLKDLQSAAKFAKSRGREIVDLVSDEEGDNRKPAAKTRAKLKQAKVDGEK
jgi:hypothetical protein